MGLSLTKEIVAKALLIVLILVDQIFALN